MPNQLLNGSIILIGEGGVGKTSLAIRLVQKEFSPNEVSTHGINISQWEYDDENNKKVRVSITDFGGQEIYYATFPLFFKKNAVYVYVHDARRESTDIEFWLSQINQFSESAAIIIVQNKIDQQKPNFLNQPYLKDKYPNIVAFSNVSAAMDIGVTELKETLKETLKKQPNYDLQIPENWAKIIKLISEYSKKKKYITYEEYLQMCYHNGIVEEKKALLFSSYLHDLGIVIHFQNDLILKSVLIQDVNWVLQAIYAILDNRVVFDFEGKISIEDINKILLDYTNHEQSIIIQILLVFQLGYKFDKENFLIPTGLPSIKDIENWNFEDSFKFEYHIEVIPWGLIEKFIVRNHERINIEKTGRNGVVVDFSNNKALIIADRYRRIIKIWILGDAPHETFSWISTEIEKLLSSYVRVNFKKLIPCICKTCLNSKTAYLYDFNMLQRGLSQGLNYIQCNVSFEEVEIDRLLFNSPANDESIESAISLKIPKVEYEWNNNNNLFFEFHYSSGKNNIFDLLSLQLEELSTKNLSSKLQIVEFENSKARVENEIVNQKVNITLEGNFKEDLLAIIRYKIQKVANKYNIDSRKLIKCNCVECLVEPHHFDFDFIRKRELKGKDIIICDKSALDVSISKLLGRHTSEKDNSKILIIQNQNNSNDMKIENQNIYGGNQQFADLIINKSQILDETDNRLLQLINENTSSPEEKKALVESLESVKSLDTPSEEKKKSGGILRKFVDSIATEGGKQIVKELAENGAEYWQYIF